MGRPYLIAAATVAAAIVLAANGCGRGADGDGARSRELANSTSSTTDGGGTEHAGDAGKLPETIDVTISGHTFSLELAADIPTRQRGLMYRDHIAPDGGMLFAFPRPDFQSFWMGWCLVDIDIIYLDDKGRVTALHQMTAEAPQQPGETEAQYRERLTHYPSRLPAQFVIELAGGTLDELDVAVGDTIDVDVEYLGRIAR
jgi:uncharacterized membrane protein (UPF0127 family)